MSKTLKHSRPKSTETEEDFSTVLAKHKHALEKVAAVQATGDEAAVSAALGAEEKAARALAEVATSSDEDFFAKAAQLLDREDERPAHGETYGSLVIALAKHIKGRTAPFNFRSAYFDLEGEITDVERIADIALVAISSVLDEAWPDEKHENWSLKLSDTEINRLYFMARHVLEMAEQMRKRYLAFFDQARASDA
jgi:hypothetical protein